MSAKREKGWEEGLLPWESFSCYVGRASKDCAPRRVCGRDARAPRKSLERYQRIKDARFAAGLIHRAQTPLRGRARRTDRFARLTRLHQALVRYLRDVGPRRFRNPFR